MSITACTDIQSQPLTRGVFRVTQATIISALGHGVSTQGHYVELLVDDNYLGRLTTTKLAG